MMNKEEWTRFHFALVQFMLDYLNKHNIQPEMDCITFSFDCLQESLKAGEWVPYSDSSLGGYDINREAIHFSA